MISFGYVNIGGLRLFGTPDDYTLFDRGSKSQIISTSGGPVLDPGYGVVGFTLNAWILDASGITSLDQTAKNALESGSPLLVTDKIYPGGKTWSGFLERPVIKVGCAKYSGGLNLPANILLTPVPITFFGNVIEYL